MRTIFLALLFFAGGRVSAQSSDTAAVSSTGRDTPWDGHLTWNFGFDVNKARLGTLNEDLSAQGYKSLPDYFVGPSFGLTAFYKRKSISFNASSASQKSTVNDRSYTLTGSGAFIDFGYAVLESYRCRLAPFVGVAIESISLEVQKDTLLSFPGTLLPLRNSRESARISRSNFPVYGGADADFLVLGGKENRPFMILGLRIAYYVPVFTTKYKTDPEGNLYRPDIFIRNLTFGVHLRYSQNRRYGY